MKKRDVKVAINKLLKGREKEYEQVRNSILAEWDERSKPNSKRLLKEARKTLVPWIPIFLVKLRGVLGQKSTTLQIQSQTKRWDAERLGGNKQANHDTEIYDDDDFFQTLLKEVIERRSQNTTDPIAISKQWLEVQKLRQRRKKSKTNVDCKASKGRKTRYVAISKEGDLHGRVDAFHTCNQPHTKAYNPLLSVTQDYCKRIVEAAAALFAAAAAVVNYAPLLGDDMMRWLEKCFYNYGLFVARNPLPFLIIPCIVTLISSVGLLNFHSQDDIWDIYAPLNALSRLEEKALDNFEHLHSSTSYKIQIIVERKDGHGLFNAENMMEITSVNRLIVDNLTVAALNSREETRSDIVFTFPNAKAMSNKMFLGYSIGQLQMSANEDETVKVVENFRLFILHYMVDLRFTEGHFISEDFETQLLQLFDRASIESFHLNYALLSRNREMTEQRKITTKAIPYLLLTGVLLTLFMLTTLSSTDYRKSQHIEAIFAIISPTMALITTFGLIWSLGFPFSNILTVVPFLVITIGIDDAFLILAGWRHSNPSADLETRMGESLAKSGASVSVTSVTDVLCFAVGIFSNLPVVQLFCLYTSVALTLDFIYQVTFFVAISTYCGRKRIMHQNDSSLQFPEDFPPKSHKNSYNSETSNTTELYIDNLGAVFQFSSKTSASAAQVNSVRPSSSSTTDSSSLTIYLDGQQIKSSRLITVFVDLLFNTWVKAINFVLNDMGSFNNPLKRQKFNKMIKELQQVAGFGFQDNATNLWIEDYQEVV
uniref:SSD domain-containing protein n=1 Tax=Ditylenchus dipsaci TaxID=166011 RepID=A0A915ECI4_9BILA